MRTFATAAALVAAFGLAGGATGAEGKKIDLRTAEGVKAVKGQWRFSDVKIVEATNKSRDGKALSTYDISPKAQAADFDDGAWEVLDPTTLGQSRSGGKVCFCWYRIKITLPDEAKGRAVFFQTTVDDYGEVWVDGKLPRKGGQNGGSVVAGFNAPNRLELKDPAPGKVYSIAVFGINGPISDAPTNRIFLGPTFLEIRDKE
jgi:gluconolactonase